jgi:hypothetical protein
MKKTSFRHPKLVSTAVSVFKISKRNGKLSTKVRRRTFVDNGRK